jgi:hypothetical protein
MQRARKATRQIRITLYHLSCAIFQYRSLVLGGCTIWCGISALVALRCRVSSISYPLKQWHWLRLSVPFRTGGPVFKLNSPTPTWCFGRVYPSELEALYVRRRAIRPSLCFVLIPFEAMSWAVAECTLLNGRSRIQMQTALSHRVLQSHVHSSDDTGFGLLYHST